MRPTFGLTLGRDFAPPCLVAVTEDRRGEAFAARIRVWPDGSRDSELARRARLLAARRPVLAARPSDARRLAVVPELAPLLVGVEEANRVLATRLLKLMRSRRLCVYVEGAESVQLHEELAALPRQTGPLVLALAMAAWVASS
jgi:hypothetical protein